MKLVTLNTDLSHIKYQGSVQHLTDGENFFIVSSIPERKFDGASGQNYTFEPETLVFFADDKGSIIDYGEICGGRNVTADEAIEQLVRELYNGLTIEEHLGRNDWFLDSEEG